MKIARCPMSVRGARGDNRSQKQRAVSKAAVCTDNKYDTAAKSVKSLCISKKSRFTADQIVSEMKRELGRYVSEKFSR